MCRGDVAIRSHNGEQRMINLVNSKQPGGHVTVGELRQRLAQEFLKSEASASKLRLIVVDKSLDNDSTPLCLSGISSKSVVQVVRKVDGG